ncbi:hypothetical protein M0R45_031194 [Rubus argutus]|uniref:Uncharacterized protein n=1 Tax=Rubus argutus TaxID=59490 RepID=A0AAW1WDD8_RUBAR
MEAIDFCEQVHNNKENIPPFFSANGSDSAKKCKKIIRLKRKPLADITNLYRFSNSVPSLRPSSSVSISASNSRKRKAISRVNETSSNSRSLRMGFR